MSIRDALRGTVPSRPSPLRGPLAKRLDRALSSAGAVERELWFAATAAMLVDVTLTVHGLAIGLVEINPFARRAIAVWGVLGLYGLKASALGVGAVCRLVIPDRYGPIVPFGLALPSFLAVVANAITIGFVTL
jgi:hypothetical protein